MKFRLFACIASVLVVSGCILEDGFERGYDCPPRLYAYDVDDDGTPIREPYLCMLEETDTEGDSVANCVPCDFKMNRITDDNYVFLKKIRGKYVYSNRDEQEENLDRKYLSHTARDFIIYKYSEYKSFMADRVEMKLNAIEGNCTRSDMEQYDECNRLCNATEDDTECTNECKRVLSRINRCSILGDYKNIFKFNSCPDDYPVCSFGTLDDADEEEGNQFYCSLNLVYECSPATVDNDCLNRITNWKSGECVKGSCVVRECNTGYQPAVGGGSCVANCDAGKHYDNNIQKCVDDDVDNCGATNKMCSRTVSQWVGGVCENGVCIVSECAHGYKPSRDSLSCASNCNVGQHYDNGAQMCVADNISNCGATGYVCSSNVDQWLDGTCSSGVCKLSKCKEGFRIVNNSCKPDCSPSQYYDSKLAKCVEGGVKNCGAPNFSCELKVDQWLDGSCKFGVCTLSKCKPGYVVVNNSCRPQCSDTEYYDDGICKSSDEYNCGQKGYNCYDHIPDVAKVDCVQNVCIVVDCNENYHKIGDYVCYPQNTNDCCGKDCISCGAGLACVDSTCQKVCEPETYACEGIAGCLNKKVLDLVYHMDTNCSCLDGFSNDDDDWGNGCEESNE